MQQMGQTKQTEQTKQTGARYHYPFQDPDLPLEQRVQNVIALLTLDEKVACLGTNPAVPRLGIVGTEHAEGLHGLAMGGPSNWGSEIGIPTTIFPQAIGLGETWDPDLLRQVAAIEGYEARYISQNKQYGRSNLIIRAPNADLGRDPRWGRTEECYGEDPYFNGVMTVAFVQGLQGDHPVYWQTAALLKHFLANSHEDAREATSSNFDDQLLREYYSVPFRMGIIEGGARAYMAAYNAVNGVPCHVHPILRDMTVAEWGQDGIICTDGGGMTLLHTAHQYVPDAAHSAAAIIRAGIGQFLDDYSEAVYAALDAGLLVEADLDPVLAGTFRVLIRLGLLDPPARVPYSTIGSGPAPWLSDQHRALARLATQKSVVLLKNDARLLPLDRGALKSVAVVGPRAAEVLLDWYSGTPSYAISPLEGVRAKVGPAVEVLYATDGDEAETAARAADVAIVCVGNHPTGNGGWAQVELPSDGKEAVDRHSIDLEQEELVKRICDANPDTVVVLISSFPYAINWTQAHAPAILHLTHCSQELGSGLANVLFGDYNPAGRLVQTWPRSLDQLPPMLDYDLRHSRTYMYFEGDPLYPFGYGLSYTTFEYANLRVSADHITAGGSLQVSVEITNSGDRSGEEVVQMYVRRRQSAVSRPRQELRGFQRVSLQAGETRTVTLPLEAARLILWDTEQERFVLEPGPLLIRVGASSADIRLETTIEVRQEG